MTKNVKYGIIGLGPIVLIAGILFMVLGGEKSGVASRFTFYDVVTGESFTASRTDPRVRIVPAPNADGERTIYPLSRDEDGRWIVQPHYHRHLIENFQGDERLRVDLTTFRVQAGR